MIENKGGMKFDNMFHKRYVGGEGDVDARPALESVVSRVEGTTYEQVLQEYRAYVRDSKAELPEEVLDMLRASGKA